MRYNDGVTYVLRKLGKWWLRRNHRIVAGPFATEEEAIAAW